MNALDPRLEAALARGAVRITTRARGDVIEAYVEPAAAGEDSFLIATIHRPAALADQVLFDDWKLALTYWLERLTAQAKERLAELGRTDAARREQEA